jgi:hypothetical protein
LGASRNDSREKNSPDSIVERDSNPKCRLGLFADDGNRQYSYRNP